MEHQPGNGESKIVAQCSYPLTGIGCVDRIYTDLAVIDVRPRGLVARAVVDGMSPDALQAIVGAPLVYQPSARS